MPELLSAVKAGQIVMVATNRHNPIIGIVHSFGIMSGHLFALLLLLKSQKQTSSNYPHGILHLQPNTNPLISFHSTRLFVLKNDFDCSSFLLPFTSIGELLANLQKLNELCKRVTKIKNMGLTGWAP